MLFFKGVVCCMLSLGHRITNWVKVIAIKPESWMISPTKKTGTLNWLYKVNIHWGGCTNMTK